MENVEELRSALALLKNKIDALEAMPSETPQELAVVDGGVSRGPGRPPYFESVEEMQAAIEQYFADADGKKWPYTIPDLALALGFTSRQSLLNYQYKPEYMDTIKRAKLRIEGQRARQLVQGQGMVAGQIFDLKNNFGWRDQQDLANSTVEKTFVQNNIGLIGMPPQPKSIEEWEQNYRRIMGGQAGHEQSGNTEEDVDCLDVGEVI